MQLRAWTGPRYCYALKRRRGGGSAQGGAVAHCALLLLSVLCCVTARCCMCTVVPGCLPVPFCSKLPCYFFLFKDLLYISKVWGRVALDRSALLETTTLWISLNCLEMALMSNIFTVKWEEISTSAFPSAINIMMWTGLSSCCVVFYGILKELHNLQSDCVTSAV